MAFIAPAISATASLARSVGVVSAVRRWSFDLAVFSIEAVFIAAPPETVIAAASAGRHSDRRLGATPSGTIRWPGRRRQLTQCLARDPIAASIEEVGGDGGRDGRSDHDVGHHERDGSSA